MGRWKTLLLGSLLVASTASAQEGTWDKEGMEPVQTIFGKRESAGGYGLFSVERARFQEDAMLTFYGLRLGWMLTRTFGVGFSTTGLVTDRTTPNGAALGLDYYGLSFETTFFPNSPAHINLVVTGGEGHLKDEDPDSGKVKRRDIVSFVEPEVNLELNMTTWFRVLLGYRHRFVSGIDTAGIGAKDLDLNAFHLGFKFGQF